MSVLEPLRHRAYRFLLAGRTINGLGNAFAPIALAFAVLDITGSASDLGLVIGARTVVNVAFLLFGGVLADRLPKHLLMVGASVAAGVTQGAVAALVLTHNATIPLLIGLAAVNGMVSALALPASASLLPLTVPTDIRQQANALNRLSLNGAAILGAPLAGVVVAAVGPGYGIAVDALAFLISAACFLPIKITKPAAGIPAGTETPARAETLAGAETSARAETPGEAVVEPSRPNIFADLRDGWSEFRSRTWLWVVVAGFCVMNAAWSGGLLVLGPVVADETIGRRAWGLVLAAETVGMLLGALVAMRVRLRRFLLFGVVNTLFMGLPVLVLGVYPHFWALLVAAFVMGVTLEQFGIAWETTMQEHVPPDKLARVYSYDMVGSFVAIPIGQIAIGPVAGAAGVEPTLIGAAVLITVAVFAMLGSSDVRTLPHKLPEPVGRPMKESVA